jgi:hypothetical protein
MKHIKRAYFIALGSNFVIFQRRKQIFIDLNGIGSFNGLHVIFEILLFMLKLYFCCVCKKKVFNTVLPHQL